MRGICTLAMVVGLLLAGVSAEATPRVKARVSSCKLMARTLVLPIVMLGSASISMPTFATPLTTITGGPAPVTAQLSMHPGRPGKEADRIGLPKSMMANSRLLTLAAPPLKLFAH